MQDPDDLPLGQDELTRPITPEERQPNGPGRPVLAVAVAAVALLVGVAAWYLHRASARLAPEAPATGAAAGEEAPGPAVTSRPATEPLPPLDASDAFVRGLVARLSNHPQLARWLVTDELVRRFVAATINVAEGSSPSTHLPFLRPDRAFRARSSAGRWSIDPASFRRYDLVAEVVDSLDVAGSAELFRRLLPLFDLAYAELGDPTSSFHATLAKAIGRLLAVPVPEPPVELVPQGANFAFADRSLEERTTAEKHLLRMGPANARVVQRKLGELAAAAGIAPR